MSPHDRSSAARRALDRSSNSRFGDWGDNIVKEEGVITVGVWNIGGFPVDGKDEKMDKIIQVIKKIGFDVVGLPKNNIYWKLVSAEDQLRERVRGWFDYQKINVSYYEGYQATKPSQVGGVGQWALNRIVHRICECVQDGLGLGRWTWQVFRGKGGRKLRVVSAYRPVYSESSDGTTWSQQKAFYDKMEREGNPRDIFTQDIQAALKKWVNDGEQVILGIDVNEDVRTGSFTRKLKEVGMRELITSRHGNQGPPTFHLGSVPIDGLYVTEGLMGCKCGYVDTKEEHCAVWLQFREEEILGTKPSAASIHTRRLKMQDPCTVQKFWDGYIKRADAVGYEDKVEDLYKSMKTAWTPSLVQEWNALDRERVKAMLNAEKKCRKIRIGQTQWTPEYAKLRTVLKFWVTIKRRHEGRRHKQRFVARLAKRAGLEDKVQASLEEASQQIIQIRERFRQYKLNHIQKREKWIEALAEARVTAQGGDSNSEHQIEHQIRALQQREAIRRCHRVIKWAVQGDNAKQGISLVIAKNPDRTERECTTQEEIEEALLDENMDRFNQGADSPFLTAPLAERVGPTGMGPASEQILDGSFVPPEEVDGYTKRLLAQLARPENFEEMQMGFNPEIWIRGWRRARERMAAGPSRLHFGHFMALAGSEEGETEAMMATFAHGN
jgi:hypothetical protein